MQRDRRRFRYPISPIEALVLLRNILDCPHSSNDTDRTVWELCQEIDAFDGYLGRAVLESALYCCNIQDEDSRFWHPSGWGFEKFVINLLPPDQQFDRYYNIIKDKEKTNGLDAKTGR